MPPAHALDALDETLDLIASRDLSVWQRRDQDELEMAAATSLYSSEDVELGMSSRFGPTVRITFGPTLAETATSNLRG